MSNRSPSFDPHAVSRAGVLDGSPVRKRGGRPARAVCPGPLDGLLASPCGVWVRIEVDSRGEGWRVLLRGATMHGLFGAAL